MNSKKLFISLLFFFNVLNYLDVISTILGINKYGIVAESNIYMVSLIKNSGFFGFILLKIFGCLAISLLFYKVFNIQINNVKYRNLVKSVYVIIIGYFCYVLAFVVVNNFKVVF